MISSARFPIVALSTPPMAALVCSATDSVAAPRTPDNGIIASALSANTASGGAPNNRAPIAIGTKTSRP